MLTLLRNNRFCLLSECLEVITTAGTMRAISSSSLSEEASCLRNCISASLARTIICDAQQHISTSFTYVTHLLRYPALRDPDLPQHRAIIRMNALPIRIFPRFLPQWQFRYCNKKSPGPKKSFPWTAVRR